MNQNQIVELPRLRPENLENIFNIYADKNDFYFYNLLQTVVFPSNLPPNLFYSYTIGYQDTWPTISYKTLKSPNLWWLILLTNNIHNPVIQPIQGDTIKIPKDTIVRTILSQISNTSK